MPALSLNKPSAGITTMACLHCGTPFDSVSGGSGFCCGGCRYVYGLIHDQGLGLYYDLKDRQGIPVGGGVFEKRDLAWVGELVREAELPGVPHAELQLHLQGISCVGCVWLVERVASDAPGVLRARMAAEEGILQLAWLPGACDVGRLVRDIESFGYRFQKTGAAAKETDTELPLRLGICGALAMNAMLFAIPRYFGLETGSWMDNLFGWISFVIASLSMLAGGCFFIARSAKALRRGILHLDVPIALGLLLAYAGSVAAWRFHLEGAVYFDFVSVFCFLMLAGRWLQNRTVLSNQALARTAMEFRHATRLAKDGDRPAEMEVPLEDVRPGERIRVGPGGMIPLAGILESPRARLGLEWISGESEALMVAGGYPVLSGSFNTGHDAVILKVTQPWNGSLLQRLVQESSGERPRNLRLEKVIRLYLQVILGSALLGGLFWWWSGGNVWQALQVAISLLVVSCPCASGVALPLADELANLRLRRKGVFIRAADCWFRLKQVRHIVFDKTGTLSMEGLRLKEVSALDRLDEEARAMLWHLADHSLHPASRCLRAAWLERWRQPPAPDAGCFVHEVLGMGVELRRGQDSWRLGRASWAAGEKEAACVLARNGKKIAVFAMEEQIRADAVREFNLLGGLGYRLYILSGDHREKVEAMAGVLGLPVGHALSGCSPDEKAGWIKRLDRNDTLMVGDGANDSLAFESAWCRATPAVENAVLGGKADFYFTGQSLSGVRLALETAERRRRAVFRTLLFTISYNVAVVILSLAGGMNPLLAAVLMPCSSAVSLAIVWISFRGLDGMKGLR